MFISEESCDTEDKTVVYKNDYLFMWEHDYTVDKIKHLQGWME